MPRCWGWDDAEKRVLLPVEEIDPFPALTEAHIRAGLHVDPDYYTSEADKDDHESSPYEGWRCTHRYRPAMTLGEVTRAIGPAEWARLRR